MTCPPPKPGDVCAPSGPSDLAAADALIGGLQAQLHDARMALAVHSGVRPFAALTVEERRQVTRAITAIEADPAYTS